MTRIARPLPIASNRPHVNVRLLALAGALVVLGVLTGTGARAQNLLVDPSFAGPLSATWPGAAPGIWYQESAAIAPAPENGITPYDGSTMLRITNGGGNYSQVRQIVNLAGPATVVASAWFDCPTTACQASVVISDATGPILASQPLQLDTTPNTWEFISATAAVPSSTTQVVVQVAYTDTGAFSIPQNGYVDDASLLVVQDDLLYSVDLFSDPTFSTGAADLLGPPAPPPGPASVIYAPASLGLQPSEEVDAITSGGGTGLLHFSVDRSSIGTPVAANDVRSESALGAGGIGSGQAASDIFVGCTDWTLGGGGNQNQQGWNQDVLGRDPNIPAGAANFSFLISDLDEMDSLQLEGRQPIAFSLPNGHAYPGGCGSDLFAPGAPAQGPALLASGGSLGLACNDDIDALHIDDRVPGGEVVYFSLTTGSPGLTSLATCGTPCSGADVFSVPLAGGSPQLVVRASELALEPTDELDALAAPVCGDPNGPDTDGDGFPDACDNCTLVANPTQWDSDVDGYGNACDADYTGDGVVGGPDFAVLATAWGSCVGQPGFNPDADANCDGCLGGPDFATFGAQFGTGVGPSGLACAGTAPCTH